MYFNFQVRMSALLCIDGLLDRMDRTVIMDEVLPFLTEIQSHDPEVIMAITGK